MRTKTNSGQKQTQTSGADVPISLSRSGVRRDRRKYGRMCRVKGQRGQEGQKDKRRRTIGQRSQGTGD